MFRILIALITFLGVVTARAETAKEIVAKAILESDSAEQVKLVRSLVEVSGSGATDLLTLWKEGGIYIYEDSAGKRMAVTLKEDKDAEDKQIALQFDTGEGMKDASGAPLKLVVVDIEVAETDSKLRTAMKEVQDLSKIINGDLKQRLAAVEALGLEQNPERLPALIACRDKEKNASVMKALRQAIALTQLRDPSTEVKIAACKELGEMGSIAAQDSLKQIKKDASEAKLPDVEKAVDSALAKIASHVTFVNTGGTLFRGLSLGSILLVAAIGLAITFGLMGVINMAHGEMIAVGAYTTYLVQNVFGSGMMLNIPTFFWKPIAINIPGMKLTGTSFDAYFLLALPLSFLVAAFVGWLLERGIIRFLYRRPLESLLATWGVSLVLQQLFRLTFGANNVQVDSPAWLSGNWTINDIIFGWNRVFVIGFAIVIVFGVNLLLKKTPLGLLIRAVMQNRAMASCMGVRTERVNMLTFALGSGLAGLAGAFLSQIGNVGPEMGKLYIVDCFMTVVAGGVGNLIGTVVSALGIGILDQSLQQMLGNPVLGKILVLAGIILFLQWRPAGLFAIKGRGLES